MNELEEIKQRINVVDLVGQYVTLKKAGANYKGVCPFHGEKTPSLMVSAEKQIWKCFGCSRGGSIFDFVMEAEHLEFGDALRLLAQKAGVTLQSKTQAEYQTGDRKERLYRINMFMARVYHQLLLDRPEGAEALKYLESRGLKRETIENFRIGLAPRQNPAVQLAAKRGILPPELQRAGSPERFFDRIIFPIFDILGNVIAFTGRSLGEAQPKYLNTPETALFTKGRTIYALNFAKAAIKEKDYVVLVEGQMDVVALHQAGVVQTVASSGTAITETQLQILSRYTPNVVIAFDGDAAGVQATKKVIELLLKLDLNGKVISFAPFKDAADFLQKNPDGWSEIVKTAAESLDWLVADAITQVSDVQFIENKKKVLKLLAPTLMLVTDSARRDYYVQKLAAALGMKPAAVTEALAKPSPGERPPRLAEPTRPTSVKAVLPRLTNEEQLLAIVLASPESLKGNERLLKSVVWQSSEAQTIAEATQTCYNDKALPKTSAQFLSAVKTHLDSPLADKLDRWQFWISETWPQFSPELAGELLTEKFGQVSTLEREQRKDTLAAEIKRAQEQGDIKKIKELLGTLSKLAQEPTINPKK